MTNRFLSAKTVINSLRDNGFSNTSYALAELIDNSLQAKATRVQVGFLERSTKNSQRASFNVHEISVWDNGAGMSPETLLKAMQFGGSENRNDKGGMGKFGMGLPNSSISQCRRVDVWSWTETDGCHHTYLDVTKMEAGELEEVPMPRLSEVPEKYQKAFFPTPPASGTLVVWSDLDRLTWKTGKSIHRHCEQLIGRLYRNFIASEDIVIESVIYRETSKDIFSGHDRDQFVANDPMYLHQHTSLPELPGNYKGEAFFELLDEEKIEVSYFDEHGQMRSDYVRIRTSTIKKDIAREILKTSKTRLGGTVWGKHCKNNMGVSIVRAGRELTLKPEFLTSKLREFKGRFLGAEIAFPPSLDVVFGVTNNKQDAVKLIPFDDIGIVAAQNGFDSEQEYKRDLEENNDPVIEVLRVVEALKRQLDKAAKELTSLSVDPANKPGGLIDGWTDSPGNTATRGSRHREVEHPTEGFNTPLDESDVTTFLKDNLNIPTAAARARAEQLVQNDERFVIESTSFDSEAFFDVSTQKGLTLVLFNENHVFHSKLISKLTDEQLDVMYVAVAGFARVMNETTDDKRKAYLHTIRREWGKVVQEFLLDESDDSDSSF